MASEYISSLSNTIYLKADSDIGAALDVSDARIAPIESLSVNVKRKQLFRNDKSGYRSRNPLLGPQREEIGLSLVANATGWANRPETPVLSPLFQSAFASPIEIGQNYTVASSALNSITLQTDSNLQVGMAVCFGEELRFVRSVQDARSFELNSPFSSAPSNGALLLGCCNFSPGNIVHTFEVFEFWTPATAVQRVTSGCCANRTAIEINNDFVTISVDGFAKALTDSVTYNGVSGVFPQAPVANASSTSAISPIAGHLGQALIGASGQRVCTLVQGKITIDNGIQSRSDEFGCYGIKAFTLGQRKTEIDLSLYERNDHLSRELYAKAVDNEPTSLMLQLGTGQGNMMGIYLPAVLVPVPAFVDSDSRVLWRFKGAVSIGAQDDEIFVAVA